MVYSPLRFGASFAALGLALAAASPALAQSRQVTTPNITNAAGQVASVVAGGVVLALMGAG